MKEVRMIGVVMAAGLLLAGCKQKPVEQRPAADCKPISDYETYETVTVDSLADVPTDCRALLLTVDAPEAAPFADEEQMYYQYTSFGDAYFPTLECFEYIVQIPEEESAAALEEVTQRDLQRLGLEGIPMENLDALSKMPSLETLWICSSSFKPTFTGSFSALTDLQINWSSIGKLGDIEKLTTLQRLSLSHTDLKRIKGIDALTSLSKLNLEGTSLYSLQPLRSMTQLTALNLGDQSTFEHVAHPDLRILEGMSNLTTLGLNDNRYGFKHTEALSDLTGLERLSMVNCKLQGIALLEPLVNLHELDLRANAIPDITPLAGMTELESLELHNNQIGELEAVTSMPHLHRLTVGANDLIDISPVGELNELEELSISMCGNLTDIAVLRGKRTMKSLTISATNVTDIETIASLQNLEVLDISGTKISDLTFLEKLRELRSLNITGAKTKDFTPITALNKLEELDISNTHIRSLEGANRLRNLSSLKMSSTNVESIEPLFGMQSLMYVDLQNVQKLDDSEITKLKEELSERGGTVLEGEW